MENEVKYNIFFARLCFPFLVALVNSILVHYIGFKNKNINHFDQLSIEYDLPGKVSVSLPIAGSSRMIWWSSSFFDNQRLHLNEYLAPLLASWI